MPYVISVTKHMIEKEKNISPFLLTKELIDEADPFFLSKNTWNLPSPLWEPRVYGSKFLAGQGSKG